MMKNISTCLFEFLYICVYRESTFQEIFKDADPKTFLEAVVNDFEVLDKYNVFQERF